ncbi:ras guanine nucleotide exchange factor domain-containing protein [Mycena capillaripes]|nr:ras guanine nucleotide exchange factor domain-containing protein [Mycena capillaripes]
MPGVDPLSVASLSLEIGRLILKVPGNRQKLDDLHRRCDSLLSGLEDASMDSDDPSTADFLAEMKLILRGIRDRLKSRRPLSFFPSLIRQGEMGEWIDLQNQRIEDAFRTMHTRFLMAHAHDRTRQESDYDALQRHIIALHTDFISHFKTESSSDAHSLSEALDTIFRPESTPIPLWSPGAQHDIGRHNHQLPQLSLSTAFSLEELEPSSTKASGSKLSSQRIATPPKPSTPSICNKRAGRISTGNLEGLVDYLIETDDQSFKRVLVGTYRDFDTPEAVLEIIRDRLDLLVRPGAAHNLSKQGRTVRFIVTWLETVTEPTLLQRVAELTSTLRTGLTPANQRMLSKAIAAQSPKHASRTTLASPVEPVEPHDLALALTFIEGDLHNSITWMDYLFSIRGRPSRLDIVFSDHEKMIRWVRSYVLRAEEIQDRASAIRRLVKAAEECLQLRNYNSMSAIASALNWKSKPILELPRTWEELSKDKQALLKRLAMFIDADGNYEAYRRLKKSNEGHYIPWFTAELDEMKRHLERYPKTVEVDGRQLVNFERYHQLGLRVSGYQSPEGAERQEHHLEYMRDQLNNVVVNDEADNQRCRKLKKKEEADYQRRKPQLKRLGL